MKTAAWFAFACLTCASSVHAQLFPAPVLLNETIGTDEIYTGIHRTIPASRPVFIMVDASYSAVAHNNGNRRNTQGHLTITINGRDCAWDNYGNEIHTSVAAGSAHCALYLASGEAKIDVLATLFHGSEGGDDHWQKFEDRKTNVHIMAFYAQNAPAKRGDKTKRGEKAKKQVSPQTKSK
jgi:hypothetical protein